MALNLADRIAVIQSETMRARVEGAVIQYALYLLGNGSATVPQKAWAKGAADNPADMARRVAIHLLDDTNFLANGSGVTDVQLQGAVEAAINTRFVV